MPDTAADPAAARARSGQTLPRVRAVSRAMAILKCFTPAAPHLSLGEIAGRAELDAGTTRRLLITLRDAGVVAQNVQTGRYCLTMQITRMASAVPDGQSLRDLAEDRLNALAQKVRATVLLSVLRDGEAVCLARFHGDAPVQVRWWSVGDALPLNCGAAPRLLLAHMAEDAQERLLSRPLPALTPRSLTDPDALRAEIARIRRNGWAHSADDVAEGLSALAAPVRDASGEVTGAVSIGGLSPLILDPERVDPPPPLLTDLLACCAEISERLGGSNFTE